jgi:hypothetical protein
MRNSRFSFVAVLVLVVISFGAVSIAIQASAVPDADADSIGQPEPPAQIQIATLAITGLAPVQGLSAPVQTPTRTPTPVNLGNFVWDDFDADGRQDAGEPGLQGITIQLWNETLTQMLDDTVTDASGNYFVVAPFPATYRIRVVLPNVNDQFSPMDLAGGDNLKDSDINPVGPNRGFTNPIVLANNVISISHLDAGIIKFRTPTPTRTPTPINLGNFVWDDFDADGRQDAGEPGLQGITVQLWNETLTQMLDDTVTDASGNYFVVAPFPATYRIRVVLPNVNDQFSPMDMASGDDLKDSDINPVGPNRGYTNPIVIANNVISISHLDAGIIKFRTPTPTRTPTPVNLGNFVWDDFDADGRQDAGEPGLQGITVQLWNEAMTLLVNDTVTDANGNYFVVAPYPATYRIRVVLPNVNDQFSPMDLAGGDDLKDSDINPVGPNRGFTNPIVLANNVISISHLDAGIIKFRTPTPTRTPTPVNLGNFVWNDLDGDGIQDAGEPGLAGVGVQLWNESLTQLLNSTISDANGNYFVVAPFPGNYRIRVLLPLAGDSISPIDQGGDDLKDNDINPSGANALTSNLISIANNVISISHIDIGIRRNTILQISTLPPFITPPPLITNLCQNFRLTSPRDGLPNGVATFYWDAAASPNLTYQVQVLENGNLLATFDGGTGTNVSGDVSQGRIGGGFSLTVRVVALQNGNVMCSSEAMQLRAALGSPPLPTRCVPVPGQRVC